MTELTDYHQNKIMSCCWRCYALYRHNLRWCCDVVLRYPYSMWYCDVVISYHHTTWWCDVVVPYCHNTCMLWCPTGATCGHAVTLLCPTGATCGDVMLLCTTGATCGDVMMLLCHTVTTRDDAVMVFVIIRSSSATKFCFLACESPIIVLNILKLALKMNIIS